MGRFLVLLLPLVLLAASCGDGGRGDLPDPARGHLEEVRSDCRSWLEARVRDPEELRFVADLLVADMESLDAEMRGLGLPEPSKTLRWRRIAERLGEEPLPEAVVVSVFLEEARRLAEWE